MSREEALKRRRKAIQAARKAGLNDDEICEALHIKAEDLAKAEALDVEVVEVAESKDLVVVGAPYGMNSPSGSEQMQTDTRRTGSPGGPLADGTTNHVGIRRLSEEWWALQKLETQAKRCKRTKRDGTRCKRMSWRGQVVCGHHGAKAPLMLAKAKERLDLASNRMAGNLIDLAENAESEAVKLGATNSALDRAGVAKQQDLNIGIEMKPYEEIFSGISEGLTRAESRRARGLEDDSYSPGLEDVTPLSSSNSEFYDATCDFSDDDCADGFMQPPAHGDPPTHTATGAAGSTHLRNPGGGSSQGADLGRAGVDGDHGESPDDGPSARVRDERTAARQSHRDEPVDGSRRPTKAVVPTVTGDDALAIAAALRRAQAARFADERGLPRGRSR